MFKQISDEVFYETYKPIKNHIDDNASFDGNMFETYGSEFDYVRMILAKEPNRVWTIIDAEGDMIISSGFHFVNRLGYLITEVPYPENEMIEVVDEE